MNCFNGNTGLWILIALLILGPGTNVLSSKALSGCGWPLLTALAYCLGKNGTLTRLIGCLGGGCGNS